jgi:hypothetical protein
MTALTGAAGSLTPTPFTISQQLVSAISANESIQAQLEQQISSGTLVNQPSDNPTLAGRSSTWPTPTTAWDGCSRARPP